MKRILITGWTGNTGSLILERAARRWPEATFVGVTRQEDALPPPALSARFQAVAAPLDDEAVLEKAAFSHNASSPFDLVLHVAHVHFTPTIMRLSEKYGVPRVLLIHTTGMYSQYREYGVRYKQIDDAVTVCAESGPCWTILRPTMIYGNSRDHNLHKLILALACSPVFPLFGDGSAAFQPVHVEDVADAAMTVLDSATCRWRAYDLSGATVATYKEIVMLIAGLLGRKPVLIPIPLPIALAAAGLGERLRPRGIGVTVEQVRRLQENKAYSHSLAARDFGFMPRSLEQGLTEEIALLRSESLLPALPSRGKSTGPAAAE
jgi:nucleoside-diphosphate-sugar epimerase